MPRGPLREPLVRLVREGKRSAMSLASQVNAARILAQTELRLRAETPARVKLAMWRKGFRSDARLNYDYDGGPDYLEDIPYALRGELINGRFRLVLDDKLVFHHVLRSHPELLPRHLARVLRGRLVPIDDPSLPMASLSGLVAVAGPVVIKSRGGCAGRGLHFVEPSGDGLLLDGEPSSPEALDALAGELDDFLVCERVFPHSTLHAMAPWTTNCLRLLTLWDDRTDQPFLPFATLSLGTSKTYPSDIRGLAVPIDVETGRLGRAREYATRQRVDAHPETGVHVRDVIVPHWELIVERILEVHRDLPFLFQVGWDVAVTETGCKIIEGNNHPALSRHQAHTPMLRDPRVRRFYERHGIT